MMGWRGAQPADNHQESLSHHSTQKHQTPRHDYEQVAVGMGRAEENTAVREREIIIENQTYECSIRAAATKTK